MSGKAILESYEITSAKASLTGQGKVLLCSHVHIARDLDACHPGSIAVVAFLACWVALLSVVILLRKKKSL